MSNASNIPPNLIQELVSALKENVKAANFTKRSFDQYSNKLANFYNPLTIASNAFNTMESTQLKALAAGTTQTKFIESNTEAVKGLQASNVSLNKFLMGGFTQGLRKASGDTMKLADEMIMTGQSTEGLGKVMGSVRLLTGNSINATSNLSKTILKTSRDQGVTSEQLIDTLQGFQEAMLNASIYGQNAVEGIGELGVALKGGLAGAAGADQAIGALLGMQDALNVAQQEQLGLRTFFDEIRTTGFNQERHMQMLVDAGDNLNKMMGSDAMVRDAIAKGFGDKQVKALLLISQGIKNFEGLSEEQKKKQKENQDSMVAYEQNKLKYFNTFAPGMHTALVTTIPTLIKAQMSMGVFKAGGEMLTAGRSMRMQGLRGAVRERRNLAPTRRASGAYDLFHGRGAAASARRAASEAAKKAAGSAATRALAMGGARMVAGTVLKFLGPIGFGASLLLDFGPSILGFLGNISSSSKKTAEALEEEKRRKREAEIKAQQNSFSMAARLSKDLISRSGAMGTDVQLIEVLKRLGATNEAMADAASRLSKQSPVKPQVGDR